MLDVLEGAGASGVGAAPTASGGSLGRRTRAEDMIEDANSTGADSTGLAYKVRKTVLGGLPASMQATDGALAADPAAMAQFFRDLGLEKVEQLGQTYADRYEDAGNKASYGVMGQSRVAWYPSATLGVLNSENSLRQLNGIHRRSKVTTLCAIGMGPGIFQLEIFAQIDIAAVKGLEKYLKDLGWPIARLAAVTGAEIAGVQRTKVLRVEFTEGQQMTFSARVLTGEAQVPHMACLMADGTIDERAIPVVHPVDHSTEDVLR
eukprot:644059-Pyramimonas_sp.AAC.2